MLFVLEIVALIITSLLIIIKNPKSNLNNDDCTASRIFQPEHAFLENTLESIEAAFHYGAKVVEIDVHPTSDGEFADVDASALKSALAYLKGEIAISADPLPEIEAFEEGDMPGSIRKCKKWFRPGINRLEFKIIALKR